MKANKIDLIKAEVERLQNELIQEKEKGYGSDIDDACILELQNVLTFIDSLQEETASEELEAEINYLSKRYPEVSFAKLSRIAVHVANWQKEQLMKNAIELPLYLDGDFLTVDYDFTESGYKVDEKVKMIIINEE